MSVTFAGNPLSLIALSSGTSASGQPYTVYGANIAPYEGQTGQLEFTSLYNVHDPALLLDDIQFSTNALTPEPSPVALTALGGLLFGARKWLARRG